MRSLRTENKQPYVPIEPTHECGENQFSFVVDQLDSINPENFIQKDAAITYEQMKGMPYLQQLSTESEFRKRGVKRTQGMFWNEVSEETEDNDLIANPLYGYKVKLIVSVCDAESETQLLIIKNDVFNQFLS